MNIGCNLSQWANNHVYISNNGTNEYIQLQTDHKQMCGMKHITFFFHLSRIELNRLNDVTQIEQTI